MEIDVIIERLTIGSLKVGSVFIYRDELYLVTDAPIDYKPGCDPELFRSCVHLKTGHCRDFNKSTTIDRLISDVKMIVNCDTLAKGEKESKE